tara:strand:+ start:374 stop:487 length:114 start_codon:yes stop_codon:yes gene_type:complete
MDGSCEKVNNENRIINRKEFFKDLNNDLNDTIHRERI